LFSGDETIGDESSISFEERSRGETRVTNRDVVRNKLLPVEPDETWEKHIRGKSQDVRLESRCETSREGCGKRGAYFLLFNTNVAAGG